MTPEESVTQDELSIIKARRTIEQLKLNQVDFLRHDFITEGVREMVNQVIDEVIPEFLDNPHVHIMFGPASLIKLDGKPTPILAETRTIMVGPNLNDIGQLVAHCLRSTLNELLQKGYEIALYVPIVIREQFLLETFENGYSIGTRLGLLKAADSQPSGVPA